MTFSRFFIDRPIFASVFSILIMIVGWLAYTKLPVTQYPEIAPPTIEVIAYYPGANADVIAQTVATPIEQEINGVEGMLYMFSQSTGDGRVTISVTFKLGTDLDVAQVLVQNRVAIAAPRLPDAVRRLGITTRKSSPNLMLVVNLFSPNATYDQTYIANYATLQIRDQLARIDGIGSVQMFGASQYSMRIWLDPDRIASLNMTAGDVLAALRSQNVQVSSGTLNQEPMPNQRAFELNVQTQGRLSSAEEFSNIVVKVGEQGGIVRVKDIGRVEIGAESYATKGYLGDKKAIALPVFQRPGSNALETSDAIIAKMEELSAYFPKDLEYEIVYNPTEFVRASIDSVIYTMIEAVFLVVLVIILFLQSWRASIIPILAIPVSLIGTFALLNILGYSLNNLTLFGLVLAIGIVVDDAIVVVENMERRMHEGMNALEAARATMDEVGGALIAMGLVLAAVFLPTLFIEGISGQFYQQFGITVAIATMVSVFVSLTLSPAIAALIFHPNESQPTESREHWTKRPITSFFHKFNQFMDYFSKKYGNLVSRLTKMSALAGIVYIVLMSVTAWQFNRVSSGFIPPQDQGYFIVSIQLPPGSSLSRTDKIVQTATDKLMAIDGVVNTVGFTGFAGATFTNATNAAAIFPTLDSFENRKAAGLSYHEIFANIQNAMAEIEDAFVVVIPPPSVPGVGNGGGFKMMIQDRAGYGLPALEDAMWQLAMAANQAPATSNVFSFFETSTPQLYLDIDRERAQRLGVPIERVFEALEIYLGSAFVNDFNFLGRTFRVTAQADYPYRLSREDVDRIRVRNNDGKMVPLGSVAVFKDTTGPSRVPRYNLYPSADLLGATSYGYSSGETLATMEALAEEILPEGIGYEWTELALQQKLAGNTAAIAFVLAVLFIFLLLAATYESLILPLAIILIVPMCLLSAITGVSLAGMDNNILTQIGFVILVGLASKNAILIVEFAKQLEGQGRDIYSAASEAARLRLRPILMTSFAFILGVVPLALASGPGAEMRQAIGITVFSGMLGVTLFGLIFTPIFYVMCRKLGMALGRSRETNANEVVA
ncbi:efflux RND transporter permease subunit [Marinibactrum halimedae]|uniref:Efflux pump membrane transporter n=1 Tax=Marinibactrum halimedae TaxID=1444977 RepID=A0AA37TCV9_9GAMM|nr:multidrug efflux RND transporter permease subunit [Marinibactrum halimedae]MCD9459442.1 multidrug efflux RND transporter permease subunit [Marinibactrum halimedae]GLS27490.1 multidrug efflux RND transporter permease subunit [Marinibactrum halimedae]